VTIRRLAILLSIAMSLAVAAPAFADTSSSVQAGYGGESGRTIVPSGQVQAEVVSKAPSKRPSATVSPSTAAPTAAAETTTASKNSLPFTGFDVVWLLVAGVALAGVGFLTRRLAGRHE
jgi:hypothetical protein